MKYNIKERAPILAFEALLAIAIILYINSTETFGHAHGFLFFISLTFVVEFIAKKNKAG